MAHASLNLPPAKKGVRRGGGKGRPFQPLRGDEVVKCRFCSESITGWIALARHHFEKHIHNESVHVCRLYDPTQVAIGNWVPCPHGFTDRRRFNIHEQSSREYDKIHSTVKFRVLPNVNVRCVCQCNFLADDPAELQEHVALNHRGDQDNVVVSTAMRTAPNKKLVCPHQCPDFTRSKESMFGHEHRTHNKRQGFKGTSAATTRCFPIDGWNFPKIPPSKRKHPEEDM